MVSQSRQFEYSTRKHSKVSTFKLCGQQARMSPSCCSLSPNCPRDIQVFRQPMKTPCSRWKRLVHPTNITGHPAWNSLPADIRTTTSTPVFKKRLETFWFSTFSNIHHWPFTIFVPYFSTCFVSRLVSCCCRLFCPILLLKRPILSQVGFYKTLTQVIKQPFPSMLYTNGWVTGRKRGM